MKKLLLLLIPIFGLFSTVNAQSNLIMNGGFEDDFWPSRQPGTNIFGRAIAYSEPARVAEYFNVQTEKYWPKIDDSTQPQYDTETGVWYLRNSLNYNYIRLFVDALKPNTPQGDKCLTFHNTRYEGASPNRNAPAYSPFQHTAFQRVSLDNSKQYALSFSYMKLDSLIGATSGATTNHLTENYASRFVAGIISSTEPTSPKDFTYVVDIPIPATGDETWKDTIIILDLPTLVGQNAALDFTNSAILFGLQTGEDLGIVNQANIPKSMSPGQVSIDNVQLVEYIKTSVKDFELSGKFNVVDRKISMLEGARMLKVFNTIGSMLYENRNLHPGQSVYTFNAPGAYLIQVDGKTKKVLVQ